MLTAVFTEVGDAVGGMSTLFGETVTSIIALVYSGTAITPLGTLILIGVAVAVFSSVFAFVIGLLGKIRLTASAKKK